MADIQKRIGKSGTTYLVRYKTKATNCGYAKKSFKTRKEAMAFLEGGETKPKVDELTPGDTHIPKLSLMIY